jgi:hypothetical protein
MPGSIIEGIVNALPGAAIAAAAAATFGFPILPAFGAALVLGGLSSALQKKPQAAGSPSQSAVQTANRTVSSRQAISPWQVIIGRVRTGGTVTFMGSSSTNGKDKNVLHMVITLAGHRCDGVPTIYADGEAVTLDGSAANGGGNATGSLAGYLRVLISLGDEAAGVQPFPELVGQGVGWNDDWRQTGRTKIYVQLTANQDVFPRGAPNISALVRGLLAYDPRTGTVAYTPNPALALAHYLTETTYGMQADYAEEINEADLTAAANACDEDVALAAGGTENRYEAHGTFTTSEQPKAIIQQILLAMAGKAVNLGDKWRIQAGVYFAPTITLSEGDVAGPISTQALVSRRENANGVKGVCVFPDRDWQPDDFPPVQSSAFRAQDGGELIWKDIDLSKFVISDTQAQRLAKIELLKIRQGLTVTVPFKLTAFGIVPGRAVSFSMTKYGWSAKAFEVQSTRFMFDAKGQLGIEAVLRETTPTIFDWATSEEQASDPAPNTNLPDPRVVGMPGNPAISEANYETRDGNAVKTRVTVSCAPSGYEFGVMYQFEYRAVGDSEWTVIPLVRAAAGASPGVDIPDIARGRYDFQVKAVSILGVSSGYAQTLNHEVVGLGDVPDAITGLSVQAAGGTAILTWDLHPAADVRKGGRIYIRHSPAMSGATWNEAYSIGEVDSWPGNAVIAPVPLKQGTYLVLAEDSVGTKAASAASISTKQAHVLAFTNLSTITEDPSFPGTHSGTVSIDNLLKLQGAGLFDDIADFDAVSDLDSYGGITASGTYTFSVGRDNGSVMNVRLTSNLAVLVDNVLDRIDDRAANIDDWTDFDGVGLTDVCDCYLEVRETDDNPSGSPTWSAWKRLDASEHIARAFQFRARLSSNDPAYNIDVTQLRVKVDQAL